MANPLYDQLFGVHAGKQDPFLHLADGRVMTYAGFLTLSAQIANALHEIGLRAGDRVALQVAKSPEALAVYAACARAGIVFLPLNTAYTVEELSYFIENSGASLIICDGSGLAVLGPMADGLGAAVRTLNADGTGSLMDQAHPQSDHFETAERNADDLAALLYTSGTTGRSKGAMLSQNNLLSNALTLAQLWRFTSDDVLLHALPIFHTHGLFVATNITLVTGGSMIFLPKFDLDAMITALPRATSMMGVPTFYTRLLADERFARDLVHHMRLFISGSAPLLADTHTQFEARTGHKILERYGMTETNMNTSNPYDGDRRAGTVGFPLPDVDLKITDPRTGATLPPGQVGQIEVRGPNVFKGYWQMPDKTAAELRPDGFFITGDLGRVDEDGYVHIVGRNKDLIISGGYNIYPKEIELVLDDQPGVLESAVIGVPHPDFGETVLGLIVPDGASKAGSGGAPGCHHTSPGAIQASARLADCGRIAAQHDGQGTEKRPARSVSRAVRGLTAGPRALGGQVPGGIEPCGKAAEDDQNIDHQIGQPVQACIAAYRGPVHRLQMLGQGGFGRAQGGRVNPADELWMSAKRFGLKHRSQRGLNPPGQPSPGPRSRTFEGAGLESIGLAYGGSHPLGLYRDILCRDHGAYPKPRAQRPQSLWPRSCPPVTPGSCSISKVIPTPPVTAPC